MQVYYEAFLGGKRLRFLATAAKVMRMQITCVTQALTSWLA